MKKFAASIIVLSGFFAINSAFAVDVIHDTTGKQKMGVVSASGAYSLDSLTDKLSAEAKAEGATSIKIVAAGGENKMYGVAEIYK
ncbi:YdgH/BhsA/McbA-like domain containing protein [Pantoea rwandensis]|uniref:Multiple stress resistance protein BhsA n=1 Tax=Pantoea rwandensis TaxID=1076550 RepID=A0A1X1D549_9GAMM|nr:YdgH/BhsA/McbA-like domain containing protein [Pantoea rwandensis]ORM71774.1 multiple stress resistance protein BhsA [Pantoea rwandensis]